MSPLVHAEVGWLLAQPFARRRDRVAITLAAVLPDLDGLGLLGGEDLYAAWHHRLCHGVFAAVITALLVSALGEPGRRLRAACIASLAFHSHIAMDLMGSGPGWPIWYLWPVDDVEWLPAWQWDLASWQNSLFGLAATLLCLACSLPFGRTPVELFSPEHDGFVVAALRARFGRGA